MITATRRDFETDLLDAAGRVFAPIPPPRIAEVQHDYDRTRLALVAYADEAEARAAVAELHQARLRDQPICVNSFGRTLLANWPDDVETGIELGLEPHVVLASHVHPAATALELQVSRGTHHPPPSLLRIGVGYVAHTGSQLFSAVQCCLLL